MSDEGRVDARHHTTCEGPGLPFSGPSLRITSGKEALRHPRIKWNAKFLRRRPGLLKR